MRKKKILDDLGRWAKLGGPTGEEGLVGRELKRIQQRHSSPEQHPPHHHHQVQAPRPRRRRRRRPRR